METATQIIGIAVSALTILGFVAGVIYKFARSDAKIESLEKQVIEALETLKRHVEDRDIHQDSRAFESLVRRVEKMDEKLDILVGFKK